MMMMMIRSRKSGNSFIYEFPFHSISCHHARGGSLLVLQCCCYYDTGYTTPTATVLLSFAIAVANYFNDDDVVVVEEKTTPYNRPETTLLIPRHNVCSWMDIEPASLSLSRVKRLT